MKLKELLDIWLEKQVKPLLAWKTYLCYRDCIKRISDCDICDEKIEKITDTQMQSILIHIDDYSKSTIHNTRIVLNRSMRFAVKNNYINRNLPTLELPKNGRAKKVEAITRQEQRIIESVTEKDDLGYVIIFLLRTGLRIGEMLELRWEDFDLEKNLIRVRKSKTSTGIREVPLSRSARLILEYCRSRKKNEFIFLNTKGERLKYSSVNRLFIRIRKETGIREFTPHVCRHTFATRMVENKVDYKALSSLLGHKSVSFTLQRYVTTDMEFLKQQINLIED